MPIPVPYFRQEAGHTCAPAVVRMILAFYGLDTDIKSLEAELETGEAEGTHNDKLDEVFRVRGLHTHLDTDGTLEEVKEFIDRDVPVIVNYLDIEDNDGHYAVVVDVTDTHVILNDPDYEEGYTIDKQEFLSRWHSKYTNLPRWFLAVYNKPI